MRKLANDLKKMLDGLAYQDAGEHLSFQQKLRVLDIDTTQPNSTISPSSTKRIALITDQHDTPAIIDTVIQECTRFDAHLDILHLGPLSPVNAECMETCLQQSDTSYQFIELNTDATAELSQYIKQHPSLAFLISRQGAHQIEILLEKAESLYGTHLPVPRVFIQLEQPPMPDETTPVPIPQGA